MPDIKNQIHEIKEKILSLQEALQIPSMKAEIVSLEHELQQQGAWNDSQRAADQQKRLSFLSTTVVEWEGLAREASELEELASMEGDDTFTKELETSFQNLSDRFAKIEFQALLSDRYDQSNALCAIHAGTGGVDAMDWAEMLLRMYVRFCEHMGWRVRIIDKLAGGEAGIKTATIEVIGAYAYGYLKAENGVHRLVRISPFDAEGMRHTSFALFEVIPDLGDLEDSEIKPDDITIDVFRASGHGGQSVNTTDSAVRITHIPTGIVVTCQNERSQAQNKETALRYLKGKLLRLSQEQREEEKRKIRGEYSEAAWGNQIRSYVLNPYKLVKDHRTQYETTDVQSVLAGDLKAFIEAYLRKSIQRH